jgi:hypothetical protein
MILFFRKQGTLNERVTTPEERFVPMFHALTKNSNPAHIPEERADSYLYKCAANRSVLAREKAL